MNRKAVIISIEIIAIFMATLIGCDRPSKKSEPVALPVEQMQQQNNPSTQIEISRDSQRAMGIRESEVTKISFKKTLKILGKAETDNSNMSEIITNLNGTVVTINTDEGRYVTKGELLIEINSPELIAAQQELIAASKQDAGKTQIDKNAVEAARKKLRNFGISDDLIGQIEKAGLYSKSVKIQSPTTGYVIKKYVNKGSQIVEGDKLIELVNINNIIFSGEATEDLASIVKKGQDAEILFDNYPEKIYKTKVDDVLPSGTFGKPFKITLKVGNPDNGIKPSMQGSAEIKIDLGTKLAIPLEAIIEKDGRKIVYVEEAEERFAPRIITTGAAFESYIEITNGLKEGEMVVSSGVTKIDAEAERLGIK